MSRIHDALKRAEEERAKRTLSSLDPLIPEPGSRPATLEGGFSSVGDDLEVSTGGAVEDGLEPLTVANLSAETHKYNWKPNPVTMLFFGQEAYAPGTEEFRTLRTRLYGMRDMQPLRTVLITSASPGAGKSFVSANLAQIFVRQPNCRALLIDGDLRWSRLHLYLGAPSAPGLSEYLRGEANELAIIQRGPMENLFFIPGGKHPTDPAELIANGRLNRLIQRVAPLFDWVILDSPPAMAVSDPRVMAGFTDGVLMVVGAGTEPFDLVQKTSAQFKDRRLLG
ncbi:MAG: CpsD/CapB family tyrosine-protein kinase, partial [Deltaproteobacteria bacterium]